MKYLFLSLAFLLSGCVSHSELRERFDTHCEGFAQYEVSVVADNEPLKEVIRLALYKKCMRSFGYTGEK